MIANLRLLSLLGALIYLGGCASKPIAPPERGPHPHEILLANAATSVAASMEQLAVVEQSARGIYAQAITPSDLPDDLKSLVNVDYQGDLKPLVYQLASTAGYKVKTYGKRRDSVPVNITAKGRSIGELLADIGYQASYRCDVVVIPKQRLVEIRYVQRRRT